MAVPLIGITTYHRDETNHVKVPAQYADAVRRAGGLPLLIQPGEPRMDELMGLLHALVLSGGGDVNPALYKGGDHATVYNVSQERDQSEIDLLKRSLDDEMPLFCICRGMQVLNVALGGTLITHIPDAMPNAMTHRNTPPGPVMHAVQVQPSSRLAEVMEAADVTTASWHHQAIDQLAPGLTPIATSADGIIEAVEIAGNDKLLAVQWHPELSAADDASQQRLFDELVRLARERM